MTKEEILKKEILERFSSIRQFAIEANIPYSTLSTALDKGIDHMSFSTVMKMCCMLSLNPMDFSSIDNVSDISTKYLNNQVLTAFIKLNKFGRRKALEYMDDLGNISKYINE
ncbi:MAG: transcriptional regulator [Lachnospiraceae bacterium]|nr:transcriptional regulator [Lachnospiraceae bacterium]